MGKIVSVAESEVIAQKAKLKNKKNVLVGGCFDILHIGHVRFLQEAKKQGSLLMVWLESDETVKRLKGSNRPVNLQLERAEMLCSLNCVDYVVLLPEWKNNQDYNQAVIRLSPDVIAMTEDDRIKDIKQRQAKEIRGKAIVVPLIKGKSTSIIASIISQER